MRVTRMTLGRVGEVSMKVVGEPRREMIRLNSLRMTLRTGENLAGNSLPL
jgi:hypothetical protein